MALALRRLSGTARMSSPSRRVVRCALQNEQSDESIPYPFVTALAATGFTETAYLTLTKLLDKPVACPTSGCDAVLDSDYADLFGIPLSLFGALVYGSLAVLAARSWQMKANEAEQQKTDSDSSDVTDIALFTGCSLLAACSTALMTLLATEFKGDVCLWCYLSASLSFSLFGTVAWGMGQRLKKATVPGASALVLGIAVLALSNSVGGSSSARQIEELQYYKPDIEAFSSIQALDLAERLKKAGAKMYGAFWCSHCYDQKQGFGKEAMKSFPYVECFPDGWKKGIAVAQACQEADVKAFPTWKINGKTIEGEMSFEALEAALLNQEEAQKS